MARKNIDTETDHGTYIGDPAKVAFQKTNENFAELYALMALGGRNMLINCGPPINQRDFAGGALAAGSYGYDRWKAGAGGCNVSINASTGVFTHASGLLQQVIELPALAWGQPLTFSVEDPSGTLNVSVGNASGSITQGAGRRGVTLTPTGSGNMTVQISATGAAYSRPQLERGSSPTPFDARHWAVEWLLCQRYFQVDANGPSFNGSSRMNLGTGLTFSATRVDVVYQFKAQMRAAPAVAISPAANWRVLVGGGAANVTGLTVSEVSNSRMYVSATVSGRTPGQAATIQSVDGANSGVGVTLDAEI